LAVAVLAMETSTFVRSVALVDESGVIGEEVERVGADRRDTLLPMVERVIARAGIGISDVKLVAVGLGPGSFTGVRAGIATAKGFCLSTGCPLAGVGSLQALAAASFAHDGPVLAALDAHRGEVFFAIYEMGAFGCRAQIAPAHAPPFEAGAVLRGEGLASNLLAVGDLSDAQWAEVGRGLGRSTVRGPRVASVPSARFVASEALAGRAIMDDGTLEPQYVRPTDAKLPGST
jgi:tRNA threonylcarbamoyladenosine biosynthesis protein TsaB